MRDIIFVSLEDWDEVWRRNQFLCAGLLERFPGMQILFVGKSRDFSHALRKLNFGSFKRKPFVRMEDHPGLSVLNPLKLFPNSLPSGRRWNQNSLVRQVRCAASELSIRDPILWINDHAAGHLAGQLGERAVVYDITDDWTQMPSIGVRERAQIVMEDRKLCQSADLVVVCSKALEASRTPRSRRLERVPNGVNASHYRSCVLENPMDAPAQTRTVHGESVLGYLGTLHRDRLDLELVAAMARRCPRWRVVLCGPDYLRTEDKALFAGLSNIEVRAAVPYKEVPSVLAGFDVCIVPHHCNGFTESLNPIKLWEYLACGKPIASTPVAGFLDYPHLVYLGNGVDGFVDACFKALTEGADLMGRRVREAEAHSWEARVDQLTEIFRQQGWLGRCSYRGGHLERPLNVDNITAQSVLGEVCHG